MDIPKCPYCSGEMRPGVLRTAQSTGVCFEPMPGLSDTVDLAGPYLFRRDIQFPALAASNADPSSYDMRKIDLSKYPVPLHRIFFTQKL